MKLPKTSTVNFSSTLPIAVFDQLGLIHSNRIYVRFPWKMHLHTSNQMPTVQSSMNELSLLINWSTREHSAQQGKQSHLID